MWLHVRDAIAATSANWEARRGDSRCKHCRCYRRGDPVAANTPLRPRRRLSSTKKGSAAHLQPLRYSQRACLHNNELLGVFDALLKHPEFVLVHHEREAHFSGCHGPHGWVSGMLHLGVPRG